MKKKIIFFHYGSSIGGAPISMIQLASKLNQNIYDSVLVFTHNGPLIDIAKKSGLKTKIKKIRSVFFYGAHVGLKISMILKFIFYYKRTVDEIKDFIKKENPYLVIFNTSVLIPPAIGVSKTGVPIIFIIREVPGQIEFISKLQIKYIAKYSSKIILTSDYIKNKYYSVIKKAITMHNAVDLESYNIDRKIYRESIKNRFNIDKNDSVLCLIGSVQKEKGHHLALNVLRRLLKENPKIKLMLIAGGVDKQYRKTWKGKIKKILSLPMDSKDDLIKRATRMGIRRNIIFTGYRTDIPEILTSCDILLFLSQQPEGFGRPIIEGMASKIPVVVTDIGPSAEILGSSSGILVQKNNEEEVYQAILKLLNNNKIYKRMGESGYKRVDKMFDYKKYVEKFEKLISTF